MKLSPLDPIVPPIPPAHIPEVREAVDVRSGLVQVEESLGLDETAVIFDTTLHASNPEAPWTYVEFNPATTQISPEDVDACTLKLWSDVDNKPQMLNAHTLEQWGYRSAFFNGNSVRLQLLCVGGAPASQVEVTGLVAGEPAGVTIQTGYCERTERRVAPSDARRGARYRIAGGGGCSMWLINDSQSCYLTAGHCGERNGGVAEFNVPNSNSNGGIVSPGPEDQYTIDTASLQFVFTGIGNDWKYVGTFPNSNTGRTAYQSQGDRYSLATSSTTAGVTVTHLGHGSSTQGTFSQTYKGSKDVLRSVNANSMSYRVDTTPGDSGSCVSYGNPYDGDQNSRTAIAIATHAGCRSSSNSQTQVNYGTNILHNAVQNALRNPRGVCSGEGAAKASEDRRYGIHFRGDANFVGGGPVVFAE